MSERMPVKAKSNFEKSDHDTPEVIEGEYTVVDQTPLPEVVKIDQSSLPEVANQEARESEVRVEYLQLKRNFKEAENKYYDSVKEDSFVEGHASKWFGLGRNEISPEVQEARDVFMAANAEYHAFANESGVYKKIAEHLNRKKGEGEGSAVEPLVADRHVFSPAEKRLELQTVQLPKSLQKVKQNIGKILSKKPVKWGMIGLAAMMSPAALAAGYASRWTGSKFLVEPREANKLATEEGIVAQMNGTDVSLEDMEQEYFERANSLQRTKTGVGIASVGAAIAAGGMSESVGAAGAETTSDNISGLYDIESGSEDVIDESFQSDSEALSSSAEDIHEVVLGDNLASILRDNLQQQVTGGEVKLPTGVTQEGISSWMYRTFPEMTDAVDVESRLSEAQWRHLGVSSGDPQIIAVNETINVQKLVEVMEGSSESIPAAPQPSGVENVPGDGVHNASLEAESVFEKAASVELPDSSESDPSVDHTDHVVSEKSVVNEVVSDDSLDSEKLEALEEIVKVSDLEIVSSNEVLGRGESIKNYIDRVEARDMLGNEKSAILYDREFGYSPAMTESFSKSVFHVPEGMDTSQFTQELYQEVYSAYKDGQITLPAYRMHYVDLNPTAINAFVDSYAEELTDSDALFNFGKESLNLSAEQWKELGFSSGDPKSIVTGDQIRVGELTKLILEKAAKDINA